MAQIIRDNKGRKIGTIMNSVEDEQEYGFVGRFVKFALKWFWRVMIAIFIISAIIVLITG